MFSANENIQLRQYKKQIVSWVEGTIPESVLDLGCNVMVMQVACTAPGCVPIETCIVVVFPKSSTSSSSSTIELIPGLYESAGGSYKTKILKPMNFVTKQDVLESLPPQFVGGLRSMEKIYVTTRDIMLGQITQLFDDSDNTGKLLLAQYLQQSLQEYINNNCQPPEWGQPFIPSTTKNVLEDDQNNNNNSFIETDTKNEKEIIMNNNDTVAPSTTTMTTIPPTGNIIIQRPIDDDNNIFLARNIESSSPANKTTLAAAAAAAATTTTVTKSRNTPFHKESIGNTIIQRSESSITDPPKMSQQQQQDQKSSSSSSVNSAVRQRQQHHATRILQGTMMSGGSSSQTLLRQLASREHAPGVRRTGCPCCDPDNPANVVDRMMMM